MNGRSLEGATVLVTGARGFLGRHLCSGLQQRGALVHRASRSAPAEPTAASRWWRVDLEDARATQELLAAVRPDLIVHLAGRVSAAPAFDLVLPTFQSLLASTVNILIAATELGSGRLIVPGSLEEPVGAAAEVAPTSPYAAAKWGASAYARMFHRLYGTPVVVARLFMTYGLDFADTRKYPPGTHAGIVVFRLQDQRWRVLQNPVRRLIESGLLERLHGRLAIVDENRIRTRSQKKPEG